MQTPLALSQNTTYFTVLRLETTRSVDTYRVKANSSFTFTFTEAIRKGTGTISIVGLNGKVFLQLDITNPSIQVSGDKLIFTPEVELAFGTYYTIKLSPNSVTSLAGSSAMTNEWSTSFLTDYSTQPLNITGGSQDDTIDGGYANDLLNGGSGGGDRINGYDGDDIIIGGDEANTYSHDDYLNGGKGNDTINGNGGADYIEGGDGNDKIFGDDGNDQINGGDGDDEIDGGAGDDSIEDNYGSKNIIRGGSGNDYIRTSSSILNRQGYIDGGEGNDKLYISISDTAYGGDGDDTFYIEATYRGTANGKYFGGTGNDTFVFGFMYSSTAGAELSGNEGKDTYAISTYYACDVAFTITDFATGANGDQIDLSKMTLNYSFKGNPFATGGYLQLVQDGSDTLLQRTNTGDPLDPAYTMLRLKNVQATNLTTDNFVGGINPNGSQNGYILVGTQGDDKILGNILNDTLNGGDGNDVLLAGSGDDILYGEAGNDTLYGEDGDDLLDGGAGNDTLEDKQGQNILRGGLGDDTLKSTSTGTNTLEGGPGNDTISGGEGISDTLIGNEGKDQISVYGWSNISNQLVQVNGGSNEDTITVLSGGGSTANIVITGGTERDTFVISRQFYGTISITDFSINDGETLDLRSIFYPQPNGNPFGSLGLLKARQEANDTVIAIDYDGATGTAYTLRDFLTLKNIKLNELQASNFIGNWNPNGSTVGIAVEGSAGEDTLTGSDLDDIIRGLSGADRLYGGSGDDTLYGGDEQSGASGDRIEGGKGNDKLFGGDGSDDLLGNEGEDHLYGDEGFDNLNGGLGNDILEGGSDNDKLSDSEGDNTLLGGTGNDYLSTDGAGKNTLDGGPGDDVITSENGNNTLIGSAGNDKFSVGRNNGSPIAISISGGDGDDVIQLDNSYGTSEITATGGTGQDTYHLAFGGEIKSHLVISDFSTGLGGDIVDVFRLLSSYDDVGNPFGASGFLRLQQVGNDTVIEFDKDGATNKEYGFLPIVTLKNITAASLQTHNFTQGLNPNGASTGLTLNGSLVNDDLKGGRLDDTILGFEGNDVIDGGMGGDKISGGDGNDIIDGGSGDDNLIGGSGNDTINDTDSTGNNTLIGGEGDDYLSASSRGKNILSGGNGDDRLTAGNGNDTMFGESGNDTIIISQGWPTDDKESIILADGGDGNDSFTVSMSPTKKSSITISGGDGIDTYRISSAVGNSTYTVLDFKTGANGDILNFSNVLPYRFNQGNPFGQLGILRAIQSDQDTVLQWDSDGPLGPKQFQDLITLKNININTITAANITGGFRLDGSSKGLDVLGTDQADRLEGGFLDDTLMGQGGIDALLGNEGNDKLYGGDGNDSLNGGLGDDFLDGGIGVDDIADSAGSNTVKGGDGNDSISIYSSLPSDINGDAGDDHISVTINNGVVHGGTGNDTFSTSVNYENKLQRELKVFGDDGDDKFNIFTSTINEQRVIAVGGQGRDHFAPISASSDSSFVVEDFQTGENGDFIDLLSIIQNSSFSLNNAADLFTNKFLEFKQQGADTQLLYDADGIGSMSNQFIVLTLKGVSADTITTANIGEYLNPKGGNVGVKIVGGGESEQIKGGLLNDELIGGGGDDLLNGWSGTDMIDGGSGNDTVQYLYPMKYYGILRSGSSYTITAQYGVEGQDTVSNVENFKFRDVSINLKIKEQARTIDPSHLKSLIELYIAFFNRVPDADGMSYWIEQIKSGKQLNQISESFYEIGASEQFSRLTGFKVDMANKDFIDTFYKNVLGRKDGADADGLNYWNTQLANGASTRSSLAIDILNAAHTFKGHTQLGYVADLLDNKVIVGQKLAIDWGITFNGDVYSRSVQIANAITATDTNYALKLIGITDADMAFLL